MNSQKLLFFIISNLNGTKDNKVKQNHYKEFSNFLFEKNVFLRKKNQQNIKIIYILSLGLPSIIRKIIVEKVEERLVWPNKQIRLLRDRSNGNKHMKCYESAGVLR